MPRLQRVGRIADDGIDSLVTELAKSPRGPGSADDGIGVNLPICGVQYAGVRGRNTQCAGLRSGMSNRNPLDIEGTDPDLLTWLYLNQ